MRCPWQPSVSRTSLTSRLAINRKNAPIEPSLIKERYRETMKLAILILRDAIKKFDLYLAEKGVTIEQELERLERNGQIIGTTSTTPRLHQTTSINSR
jgi:hypothetical protein